MNEYDSIDINNKHQRSNIIAKHVNNKKIVDEIASPNTIDIVPGMATSFGNIQKEIDNGLDNIDLDNCGELPWYCCFCCICLCVIYCINE